jgi:ParB family chromosome partitioning protein
MLGRLWGAGEKNKDKMVVEKVPLNLISPSPYQSRTIFNEKELEDLAASIKEHGILQPLILRKKGESYELVAGERRLRAARMVGLKEVPCIIRHFSDEDVAVLGLIENLQRSDLHYLEEANGYEKVLEKFNLTQQELADKIGKSQSTLANKLRLLKLSKTVQDIIVENEISERHARALLSLDSEELQLKVVEEIINKNLTVQASEKIIAVLNSTTKDESIHKGKNIVKIFKDLRLFLNSMKFIVDELRGTGTDVIMEEFDEKDHYEVRIRIAKDQKGAR